MCSGVTRAVSPAVVRGIDGLDRLWQRTGRGTWKWRRTTVGKGNALGLTGWLLLVVGGDSGSKSSVIDGWENGSTAVTEGAGSCGSKGVGPFVDVSNELVI